MQNTRPKPPSPLARPRRRRIVRGIVTTAHQGKRECARRLRQLAALQAKRTKAQYGVEVDATGRTPAGLVIPNFKPTA